MQQEAWLLYPHTSAGGVWRQEDEGSFFLPGRHGDLLTRNLKTTVLNLTSAQRLLFELKQEKDEDGSVVMVAQIKVGWFLWYTFCWMRTFNFMLYLLLQYFCGFFFFKDNIGISCTAGISDYQLWILIVSVWFFSMFDAAAWMLIFLHIPRC